MDFAVLGKQTRTINTDICAIDLVLVVSFEDTSYFWDIIGLCDVIQSLCARTGGN